MKTTLYYVKKLPFSMLDVSLVGGQLFRLGVHFSLLKISYRNFYTNILKRRRKVYCKKKICIAQISKEDLKFMS